MYYIQNRQYYTLTNLVNAEYENFIQSLHPFVRNMYLYLSIPSKKFEFLVNEGCVITDHNYSVLSQEDANYILSIEEQGLTICEYCGNVWDGMAQCVCYMNE